MTGYLLAQIYGALGDSMKSSEYCLRTLQRQLKQEDGCRLNWALDCMTLSQYYTEKRVFECSYQCLVASQSVLDALCAENNIKLEEENKQKYKSDEIERAKSDLDWIWGKFYLSLLMTRSVVENLKDSKTTMNNEDGQVDLTSPLFPTLLHLTSSKSTDFPPPPPSSSPSSSSLSSSPSSPSPSIPSPSSLPSTSQNQDEAYFTAGVQSLERAATSYFSMQNGHITEYIQLVQDQSQLYKLYSQLLLMNKEQSDGQQQQQQQHQQLSRDQKILEFQQKRVNLLETVLKSGLNAHYYGDVLKQVSFEAAGAYESIVETKESEFTTHCASGGVGSFKSVQCKHAHERDINTSIFKAITTYEQFVALYPPLLTLSRGAESNEQQQRQQDEEEEEEAVAVATALVRMGILWGRLHMIPQQQGQQQQQIDLKDGGDAVGMMMDVDEMLEVKRTWMQKSVDCYSIVDAYYSKNGLQDFDDQIEFVREMLPLLDRMLKDF
ncbi:KIF-1 binding protein C terminal-domain-containing protein [Obelidium mucronatum]|nr:KIF-1 binding protein C terminal-domain-containing protein [Obelidium mucronatum]